MVRKPNDNCKPKLLASTIYLCQESDLLKSTCGMEVIESNFWATAYTNNLSLGWQLDFARSITVIALTDV